MYLSILTWTHFWDKLKYKWQMFDPHPTHLCSLVLQYMNSIVKYVVWCSMQYAVWWTIPPGLDFGRSFHVSSPWLFPLYQFDLFMAFSLSLWSLFHPAFGNIGWKPGSVLSSLLLFTLSSKDRCSNWLK